MPNEYDSLLRTIESADEKNQIGFARHLCERYLLEHPDHVPTLIRYACNLISLAQYAEAQAALDRAQPIAPKERLHLVIAQRGHLLEAQGNFIGAEALFMEAHELDPDDATYLIYAGSMAFRRGDVDRAEALARRAAACSAGSIEEAWFNLGGYLLSARRYTEAAECYRRAIAIDQEYYLARTRLIDVELILKEVS
jgi:tetratricopeptide (TPR) repeat protein